MKIAIMVGLAMPLSLGTAFAGVSGALSNPAALDESDCRAIWSEQAAGEDRLSYDKAAPYVGDLQAADPDNDGHFDETEFVAACQKGLVQSVDTTKAKHSRIMLPRLREGN